MKKLIAILFVLGCSSAQETVKSAVKTANDCSYLEDYAVNMVDALNDKEYALALNIAGAAYMKSLETPQTPCLEGAKQLSKQATQFIIESTEKKDL